MLKPEAVLRQNSRYRTTALEQKFGFGPDQERGDFQQMQERRRGAQVVRRQRLRTFAKSQQQHLAVAHDAEPGGDPPKLRAKRLEPFDVEQRAEGPEVRAQLASGDARLVDGLRVTTGADQRIVMQQGRDRLRKVELDDVARRRVRGQRLGRDLWRLDGTRAQGADVLGRRVGRSGPGAAQARDQGRDDAVAPVVASDLDLDLAEARRDAPTVSDRHLVVHDLGDPRSTPIDQPHAAPQSGQARHRHKLRLPHVGAHHLKGSPGRLGTALEGQLVPLQHSVGLARRRRRLGELESPSFTGAPSQ